MNVIERSEIVKEVRRSINFDSLSVRTSIFAVWCATAVLAFWPLSGNFIRLSLEQRASQWVLVPVCLVYLIWSSRKDIFSSTSYTLRSLAVFAPLAAGALLLKRFLQPSSSDWLSLLSLLLLIASGFWFCYGTAAMRRAAAPLCLLVLLLPIPTRIANESVSLLQSGSTSLTAALFSVLGIPVYREGFFLTIPGITIEVARECSGINSSVALLITMLVVGFETLKTTWRRIALLLISIPLSILKNAIRITTLTLLALHVNPGFLTGKLHHQGGFVFYLASLAVMYPVWNLLRRGENFPSNRMTIPGPSLPGQPCESPR